MANINHPNRDSAALEASRKIIDEIFLVNSGQVYTRVNGQAALISRGRLCIDDSERGITKWMPLAALAVSVTKEEVDVVTSICWDGSNNYKLNCAVLSFVGRAIDRFNNSIIKESTVFDGGSSNDEYFRERVVDGVVKRTPANPHYC